MLRLIGEGRAAGYVCLFADTLPSMDAALRLYDDLGFTRVGPYSADPTPDAVYLRLVLTAE